MSETDVSRACAAIAGKARLQAQMFAYLDGDHPLTYTASRLREIFPQLDGRFSINWCEVVVGALLDRINLRGLESADESVSAALANMWNNAHLATESDLVHESAVTTGEAFLLVWPGDDGLDIYQQPSWAAHVAYDSERPRLRKWAAKRWLDDELNRWRLNLYYPERIEKYQSQSDNLPDTGRGFSMIAEEPNPYGIVPMFRFAVHPRRAKSDLASVIPVQDSINKLLADMMISSEFGSAKQRYRIGGSTLKDKLRNGPGEFWDIPGADIGEQPVSVGEFTAAELENFLNAMDKLAGYISAITRVPAHYFVGGASQVSGEALIALEAPLNHRAQDRIDRFSETWSEVAAFALLVEGVSVTEQNITPTFDRPETVQPRTAAEITQMRVTSGMPLVSALRREGLTEAELEQIEQDRAAERQAQSVSLGQALIQAERANRQAQRNSGAAIPPDEESGMRQ